jgi:hypothetical protein
MHFRVLATLFTTVAAGAALAQPPAAPGVLPPTVLEPVVLKPAAPPSPAEAARQREAIIKNLKEDLVTFDPAAVTARAVDGRWQVRTATDVLKDFGADRASAMEAVRLIQDLRVNQVGTVKGSNPPFEYWLADGKPPRVANARAVVLPVSSRSVRPENVGGTWVVTDGSKGLYDFGPDADGAKRAATVYWKYGFNQLGVVGSPQPTMLVPLTDPVQAGREKTAPPPATAALSLLNDVSRTSLLLPGNVYAGPKKAIDASRLQVVRRDRGEVVLVHGDEVLARFGSSEVEARAAMRALQDGQVTEVARIGSTGLHLFLTNGQPIHGSPLGAAKANLRADRVKVQKIRESWWVTEDNRPLIEAGTRDDAELLIQVIKVYDLHTICTFGRPESGGLRLLTMGH